MYRYVNSHLDFGEIFRIFALQRRVIAAAVALLLFTKPAVGVFSGGMVETKSDLVFSTKHLVEITRHLVFGRCFGRAPKCYIGDVCWYKKT